MDNEQRLEQRIKTLEYEIKILKNEIQRTLLDIQEQVLSHYYPELRSAGGSLEDAAKSAYEQVREKKKGMAGDAPEPEPVIVAAPAESASVATGGNSHGANGGGDNSNGNGNGSQDTPGEMTHTQIVALSSWAHKTITKTGQERTSKIVETCADRSWIRADIADFIRKLIAMEEAGAPPELPPTNELLQAVMDLCKHLGRNCSVDDAISIIDEAKLG